MATSANACDHSTSPSVVPNRAMTTSCVEERIPEHSQQVTLRALDDRRLRELVESFADAFERGEVDAVLGMLAEDATFSMPPYREWCQGRNAIAKSWLMPGGRPPRLRYVRARANGQPALGTYLIEPKAGRYVPIALDVLTLRGDVIADVTVFRTPATFPRFRLPDWLPISGSG